jgi:hypothetical protein
MTKLPYLLLISASVMFYACEEIIEIDLEEGLTRLVVEGKIERNPEDSSGYQRISLSTTDDYFANGMPPRALGAEVTVSDDLDNVYSFTESLAEPGIYETDSLLAELDRTYTLTIMWDGDTYLAEETLLSVAAIDSIYQEFEEDAHPFGKGSNDREEGYTVKIDFRDPAGVENFYMWELYVDGELEIEAEPSNLSLKVQSDELYDGQEVIGHQPGKQIFEPRQTILIRQIALSPLAYDYYYLLFEKSSERGMFDTPPATVRGNVRNLDDPDLYPLGFFGASEVAEAEIVISEE